MSFDRQSGLQQRLAEQTIALRKQNFRRYSSYEPDLSMRVPTLTPIKTGASKIEGSALLTPIRVLLQSGMREASQEELP